MPIIGVHMQNLPHLSVMRPAGAVVSPFTGTNHYTAAPGVACFAGQPAVNDAYLHSLNDETSAGRKQSILDTPSQLDAAPGQHMNQPACLSTAALKQAQQQVPNMRPHWLITSHQGLAPPQPPQQLQWLHGAHPGWVSSDAGNGSIRNDKPQPIAPAMNAAARQLLSDCISTLDGISPAARTMLQQVLARVASIDSLQSPTALAVPVVTAPAASDKSTGSRGQIAVDRGASMTSIPVAKLLQQNGGVAVQQAVVQQQQEPPAAPAPMSVEATVNVAARNLPPLQVQPSVGEDAAAGPVGFSETRLLPRQPAGLGGRAASAPTAATSGHLTAPMLSLQVSGGKSAVTNRTRVLAAELGVVRAGGAGSTLRYAGTICRSNSGTLVDSLLSEAARAEAGLMTAGLPRSDSLPDVLLSGSVPNSGSDAAAPAAGGNGGGNDGVKAPALSDSIKECLKEVSGLASLNIMDLDIPMTLSGLPSLSFMLEQRSLMENRSFDAAFAAAAAGTGPPAAHQQLSHHHKQQAQQPAISNQPQQPQQAVAGAAGAAGTAGTVPGTEAQQQQQQAAAADDDNFAMHPTPFLSPTVQTDKDDDAALTPTAALAPAPAPPLPGAPSAAAAVAAHWVSRALGRAPSFTARGRVAAAIFAHDQPGAQPVAAGRAQTDAAVAAAGARYGAAVPSSAPAATAPLSMGPPALPGCLNPNEAYYAAAQQQQQYAPACGGGGLNPSTSTQIRQLQVELGMFGTALAAAPGMGQQQVQPQDTLDRLLQQVDQELMAEAYAKQRSALQFGTMDASAGMHHMHQGAPAVSPLARNAGGAIVSPFTGLPGGSMAANQAAGGGLWPGQGIEVFDLGQTWQMGPGSTAGGVPGYGPAAAAGGGYDPSMSRGMMMHGNMGLGTVPAAAPADRPPGKQEIVRYSRIITCKTYLKRLNITQPMAEHLLPYHNVHGAPMRTTSTASAMSAMTTSSAGDEEAGTPRAAGKTGSSYELMFKEDIHVVDEQGGRYKVVYEGVSCNQQKHLRLTSGWRDYIRGHSVEVGDTVVFERRGDDRHTLYVNVIKGEGDLDAAGGDDTEGQPAKKRRVSRSQAVQRLE